MRGDATFEAQLHRLSFILWTISLGLIVSAVVAHPRRKETR